MSVLKPPLAPDILQDHIAFARRSYWSRLGGLALGYLMLGAVLYQQAAPVWAWVLPALHCFIGPHLGWWLARRSAQPRDAERRNLLADHLLGGLWMVLMQFNLLPCVLTLSLLSMNSMAGGGVRLVLRGLLAHGLGVLLGLVLFGLRWQPEPSLVTVWASLPLMVCQPILISYIARKAFRRLKKQSLELRHQSQHDGLSGLYNRAYWEQQVRAEFARFRRQGEPAVLVLADLDHFKRINDLHGHAAGDEAIRQFADALHRVLRETDICGRYGGEEFGLLLPMTAANAARDVLNRLRSELHAHPLISQAMVTASFGVAELSADVPSVEAWLRLADQMLYRAKHLGRDCVVVLGEPNADTLPTPVEAPVQPPRYADLWGMHDPTRLTPLLAGLEMGEVGLALFDPSDRLVLANPALLSVMVVPPGASSFGDIMRNCYAQHVGPRIETTDINVWLRAADGKRRSQPQRNFTIEYCDGRWFRAFETSYSDGWMLLLLFEVSAPAPKA